VTDIIPGARDLLADCAPGTRVVDPGGDLVDGDADLVLRTVETLLANAAWHADDGV
jgi:hypothetical protein